MSVRVRNTLKKFLQRIDRYSPWPGLYDWMMSPGERSIFDATVRNCKNYLEFGAGGSTLRVLQKSKATVHSVESSDEWISHLRRYFMIRRHEGKRLTFHLVDIGPTLRWGYPADISKDASFPDYSATVFNNFSARQIDVILIDGRFRVACALSSIIHALLSKQLESTIMIHDYWHRDYYHEVQKYLEMKERADSLGVFRIKQNIDLEQVSKDYDKYKFDPR